MAADETSTSPKRKIKVKKKIKKKKLRPAESRAGPEEETIEPEEDFAEDEEIVITLGKPPKETVGKEEDFFLGEEPFYDEEETEGEYEEEPRIEEEEKEEVVVISLGKPPEKPAEEAIEEEVKEEPVEVEVVAEGEKAKPPEEEEHEKKRKIGAAAVVFIIIVAAIIGGLGGYFLFFQNQDPVAKLTLSPGSAVTGQDVVCDGSNSSDDKGIIEYKWHFGDDKPVYTEDADSHSDGRFDGKTTHSYDSVDTYTVELQVRDEKGKIDTTTSQITISELEVTIPFDRVGDEITYDVEGYVDVVDAEGLYSTEIPLGKATLTRVHVDYEGFMETANRGTTSQQDGYGDDHETLERYNSEDLELSGEVYYSLENAGSGSFPIQDGTLTVKDSAYIDLTTNKTIHSDTTTELDVTAGPDIGFYSKDNLRSYPHLREKPAVFRVEDLSPDRSFKVGDSQLEILGEVAYRWEVVNATNVNGYPALGIDVEIDVDDETLEPYTISEFDMQLYITNGIPFPIKTHVYGVIEDGEGTTITVLYDSEIQDDGFEKGGTLIPFGICPGDGTEEHYPFRHPDYVDRFINWTGYIPEKGLGSVSYDFSPQKAIEEANSSSAFRSYLSANPEAYVTNGYYNETQDNPLWNLTFGGGELWDTEGYYIVIEDTGSGLSIVDEDALTLPELVNTTADFDPVLSFSASEAVFRDDQVVNQDAFNSQGQVDFFAGYNYGVRANVIYPSISITVSLALERTEYAYYLEKEDGRLSAGVDAMNGQLMYVWEHEGDVIPFP